MNGYKVILFYKFIHIADPAALVLSHKNKCNELGILGRMIVAEEGINVTLEGKDESIEAYKAFLINDERFADIIIKESIGNGKAFPKLKAKVRNEVVTLGAGKLNIQNDTAPVINSDELQGLYDKNEDFVVLDLRNDYEIASGKFEKTIDPELANFRDLTEKLRDKNSKLNKKLGDIKNKKIVTVCTGGIRCEKATCLLKNEGYTNIYQLKDGIHTYMDKYPGKNFKGTLFVFDNRMTTDVVAMDNKEMVGRCVFCNTTTENYCSDDRTRPSKKVLCCGDCFSKNKSHLRESVTEN